MKIARSISRSGVAVLVFCFSIGHSPSAASQDAPQTREAHNQMMMARNDYHAAHDAVVSSYFQRLKRAKNAAEKAQMSYHFYAVTNYQVLMSWRPRIDRQFFAELMSKNDRDLVLFEARCEQETRQTCDPSTPALAPQMPISTQPKDGPLGLRTAPSMASNGELHETAESGEDVLARWRRQLATREGAPKHVLAKDATRCIGKIWKADNPASFEYGLVHNTCDKPIQVAYCSVGVDCEANKGSIRTLQPGEASRYGDRDHKRIRAHACFGNIHPIGKLEAYACE